MTKIQRAVVECARRRWEVAHMRVWIAQERVKGRAESELTWGNCIRETGVLTTDAHGRPTIDSSRSELVPPLSAYIEAVVDDLTRGDGHELSSPD